MGFFSHARTSVFRSEVGWTLTFRQKRNHRKRQQRRCHTTLKGQTSPREICLKFSGAGRPLASLPAAWGETGSFTKWHLVEYIQIVSGITRASAYESISVARGREIWQHLSEAWPARKEAREERRDGSTGVGGLPRTFKRAVRGRWSMKDPVGWTYNLARVCACVCVYSRASPLHRFKALSWSSSTQKIAYFQMSVLSFIWNKDSKHLFKKETNKN